MEVTSREGEIKVTEESSDLYITLRKILTKDSKTSN